VDVGVAVIDPVAVDVAAPGNGNGLVVLIDIVDASASDDSLHPRRRRDRSERGPPIRASTTATASFPFTRAATITAAITATATITATLTSQVSIVRA